MGVAPVAGVKREEEAGILEFAIMLKTGTFSPLFPFSPFSRAQFPRSPSPFKAVTYRLLLGD